MIANFIATSELTLFSDAASFRLNVTKAERSSMQEIWQEVSENKSIYSRLWSFGVRSLWFRECGLYEASDLLLDDHLTSMLNADQKRIYNRVNAHLVHHKRHEDSECKCDLKPLRMFISGVGGTGKSFLIEALKLLVGKIWSNKELTVIIAATHWFSCRVVLQFTDSFKCL